MVRGTIKEKMINKKSTNLTKRNGKRKMTNGKKNMNMALGDNRKQKEGNDLEKRTST
jgi:hypothetical protein